MFAFTYLPQLAVLVFTSGPLAVFSTVLLVLNESSAITNMISRNWLLQQSILDTFDGTLISRNAINMVRQGREVKSGSDPIKRLGKTIKNPFTKFSPTAIIRYIMYLPLNFIPVVGTAMFLYLQGTPTLPPIREIRNNWMCSSISGCASPWSSKFAHISSFWVPPAHCETVLPAEELDSQTARRMVRKTHGSIYRVSRPVTIVHANSMLCAPQLTRVSFIRFGFVATLLEMVPVANIFFTYTNTGKPLSQFVLVGCEADEQQLAPPCGPQILKS
jgi:hypothetical protein